MRGEDERDYVDYVRGRLPRLRQAAYALCGDAHRADDIVQATVVRLYAHWRRASAADNLDGYVHRMLVRRFLDEKRLHWSRVLLTDRELPRSVSGDPEHDELHAALRTLPPGQRAVMVLRYLCDLSIADTAAALRCSEGNVKAQTSRAIAALRPILGADTIERGEPMNEIEQLSARLHAIAPGPGRLDAETALILGRRRARRRRAVAAGGAFAAVVALVVTLTVAVRPEAAPVPPVHPSPSPTPLSCVTDPLPDPRGYAGLVLAAADPSLRFIAATTFTGTVLWDDEVPQVVPFPAGVDLSRIEVNAVNTSGDLAGALNPAVGWGRPFVHRDGHVIRLGVPAGLGGGDVYGLNARGDAAGTLEATGKVLPVWWPAATPQAPRLLPLPSGAVGGWAMDIADEGTIVGFVQPSTEPPASRATPYVWEPDGRGHPLSNPEGPADARPLHIRGDWIVGVGRKDGRQIAVRWNRVTGTVEVINPEGTFGAVAASGAYVVDGPPARLVRDGQSVALPGLRATPRAISDDGTRIVGQSRNANVIWRC